MLSSLDLLVTKIWLRILAFADSGNQNVRSQ